MKNFMCIAFSVPNDKMYPYLLIMASKYVLSLQIIDRESYSCGPSNSYVPYSNSFPMFGFYFPVLSSRNIVSKKVTVVFFCCEKNIFLQMWGNSFLHTFVNTSRGVKKEKVWMYRKRSQQVRNNKKNNITFSPPKPWVAPLHPVRRTISRDRWGRLEVNMAEMAESCPTNVWSF